MTTFSKPTKYADYRHMNPDIMGIIDLPTRMITPLQLVGTVGGILPIYALEHKQIYFAARTDQKMHMSSQPGHAQLFVGLEDTIHHIGFTSVADLESTVSRLAQGLTADQVRQSAASRTQIHDIKSYVAEVDRRFAVRKAEEAKKEEEKQRDEVLKRQEAAQKLEQEVKEAGCAYMRGELISQEHFIALLKKYDIWEAIPLRTKGWINRQLVGVSPTNIRAYGRKLSTHILQIMRRLKSALAA